MTTEQNPSPGLADEELTVEERSRVARETTLAWAVTLVDEFAWVLHTPSRVIARCKRLHDGIATVYVSPQNDKAVAAPGLELEDGNTFVAVEGAFVVLQPEEVDYYLKMQRVVGEAAKQGAELGARLGMQRQTALLLLGVALRQTATVVEVAQRQVVSPRGG